MTFPPTGYPATSLGAPEAALFHAAAQHPFRAPVNPLPRGPLRAPIGPLAETLAGMLFCALEGTPPPRATAKIMEEVMKSMRVVGFALIAASGAWMGIAQAADEGKVVVAQAAAQRAPVVVAQAAPFKSGPVQASNVAPAAAGGGTAAMGALAAGAVVMIAAGGSNTTVSH